MTDAYVKVVVDAGAVTAAAESIAEIDVVADDVHTDTVTNVAFEP